MWQLLVCLDGHATRNLDALTVNPAIVFGRQAATIVPMSSASPARPGAVMFATCRFTSSRLSRTMPPLKSVAMPWARRC